MDSNLGIKAWFSVKPPAPLNKGLVSTVPVHDDLQRQRSQRSDLLIYFHGVTDVTLVWSGPVQKASYR